MSHVTTKPVFGVSNKDTNQAVQQQKMAIGLKFWILCRENKGADQLRGDHAADLTEQLICAFISHMQKQVFLMTLMWMMLLHLHVNLNDDDEDLTEKIFLINIHILSLLRMCIL